MTPGRSILVESAKEGRARPSAVIGQGVQVTDQLVHRGGIEFEIPGMDDGAEGRGERQRSGLNDAVGEPNELHVERTDVKRPLGVRLPQFDGFRQAVLASLGGPGPGPERRPVNGRIHLVEYIRQGPDVVLMAVGEDDGPQVVLVLAQVVISGMTISTPSMPGSGNMMPQSTTIISSPYS